MQQERKNEVCGILTMEEYLNRRKKIRKTEYEKKRMFSEEISPVMLLTGLYI